MPTEYVRAARLVAQRARSFSAEVLPLLRDLFDAILDVLLVSFRLLVTLARPLLAFLLHAQRLVHPFAAATLAATWHAFAAQPPRALAAEAASAVLLTLLLILENRFGLLRSLWQTNMRYARSIAAAYTHFKRNLRTKSKLAAALLAHALFLLPLVLLLIFSGPAVDAIVQRCGLFFASVVFPVYGTLATLYHVDGTETVRHRPSTAGTTNQISLTSSTGTACSPSTTPFSFFKLSRSKQKHNVDSINVNDSPQNATPPERRALLADSPAHTASTKDSIIADSLQKPIASSCSIDRRSSLSKVNASSLEPVGTRPEATNGQTSMAERSSINRSTLSRTPPQAVTPNTTAASSGGEHLRHCEAHFLRFWSVYGLTWAARTLVYYFAPSILARFLIRMDSLIFFFLVWLQLDLTHGTELVFSLLASTIRHGYKAPPNAEQVERLNILLRILVSVGLVETESAKVIGSTIIESGLALFGVVFFITPRVATFVGTVIVGLVFPVYLTMFASSTSSLSVTRQTWLTYWAAYRLVDTVYWSIGDNLNWFPLWYHIKLAVLLWLQLPYYRGAGLLLDKAMGYVGNVVSVYKRKTVTPQKRKQA